MVTASPVVMLVDTTRNSSAAVRSRFTRSDDSRGSPSSSGRTADSAASDTSASAGTSRTPATPRSARIRRSTLIALSRSSGRVASSSSPAATRAWSSWRMMPQATYSLSPAISPTRAGIWKMQFPFTSLSAIGSSTRSPVMYG